MRKLLTLGLGLLLSFSMAACGTNSESTETSSSEATTTEITQPVETSSPYTITDEEYSLLKSELTSPKIFIEGNLTCDLFVAGYKYTNKISNGKIDFYFQGEHLFFDIDVDTYDTSAKTANVDVYDYDEDDGWSKSSEKIDIAVYSSGIFGLVPEMPSSLESYTYNEDTRLYSGTEIHDDESITYKFMVKNKQFLSLEFLDGNETVCKYEFYDYGTTTVTFPEV